uniref:Uncharacterized protein n=1 Tax=Romanomermis culicivorax TaxID=13658 RepID=A0A915L762_ROMCU
MKVEPSTKIVPSFQVLLCNRKVAAKVEPTCEGRSFVESNSCATGPRGFAVKDSKSSNKRHGVYSFFSNKSAASIRGPRLFK